MAYKGLKSYKDYDLHTAASRDWGEYICNNVNICLRVGGGDLTLIMNLGHAQNYCNVMENLIK